MNGLHMKDKRALISLGALTALAGFYLSGPLGFLVVQITRLQPAWTSASNFAANYHLVQDIPYYLGFILVGGMLLFITDASSLLTTPGLMSYIFWNLLIIVLLFLIYKQSRHA
jgi:hypothetical protein